MPPIDWKLLARHFAGETTREEDTRVAVWGASARRRRALLDLLRRVWAERAPGSSTEQGWRRVAARTGIRQAPPRAAFLRRWWPVALAASLAAVLYTPALRERAESTAAPPQPAVYSTGPDESYTLRLADGTVVRLAPGSTLRVSASNEREVWLEGRAFFAVRSDSERSFIAHTRAGSARVLGTRFVLDAAGDSVSVSVMEGLVALRAGGAEVEVGAGNSSVGAFGSPPTEARPVDVQRVADWIGDMLIFQETPLAEAAREIGRVYGVQVVLDDSALEARTLSAVFHEQPLERVMTTVCRVVEARCSTSADTVRIRR